MVTDPAIAEDPSLANLSSGEFLDKVVTLETTRDLEFSTRVMMEGLRFKPSAATSVFYFASQEVKLGKYTFQKDDILMVNFEGLGYNPTEWQRPMEFLPERFDNSNPLSLTPAGKKRHPMSWVPFHGGNRVCFGKTLAESKLRIMMTYLT